MWQKGSTIEHREPLRAITVPATKPSLRRRMNSECRMSGYRLYCLDGVNKVASAEWIEADDDAAAIEEAKRMHPGYQCELWQGTRLVARLDLRSTDRC
jgi:hypothetical protein